MTKESFGFGWWVDEFKSAKFGDVRLKKRLTETASLLAMQPSSQINMACESWSDTKASYRLFANEKVTASAILAAHRDRTWERAKDCKVILAIQDTSFLNFTTHEATTGLGKIGSKQTPAKGLVQHTTIAMTTEGVPLGILDQQIWARKVLPSTRQAQLRKRPLHEKESVKWLNAVKIVQETVPTHISVVTVADRECDVYEFITESEKLGSLFAITAARNRTIYTTEEGDETSHLWSFLRAKKSAGKVIVQVPAKGASEPAREATLNVKFSEVELKRPQKDRFKEACGIEKSVLVSAIFLEEINAPVGSEKLEWMLMSNIVISSFEDALEKMNWYRLRWGIEVFHKILKSGCQVEACRLGSAAKLTRYLALMSIISWRLHWMTRINIQTPDAPCSLFLMEHEWQSLWCKINKKAKVPKQPPTVRQALRWNAQLGGHLARKGDGQPGIVTTWRGWQRLNDISEDWLLFHKPKTCG